MIIAHLAGTLARLAEDTKFDPDAVTPGPWGFIAVAALGLFLTLLGLDLTRRLRRSRYRAEVREQIAAELAEQDQAPEADAASGPQRRDAQDPDPESPDGDGRG